MLEIFVNFYFLGALGLFIALIVGTVVSSFINHSPTTKLESLFKNLLTGLITIVTTVSLIKTSGVTINFLVPIVAISIIWFSKLKPKVPRISLSNLKNLFHEWFYCLIFLIPFFLQEFYYFIDNSAFHFIVPCLDFNFYANISGSLMEYGVENKGRALNFLFPELNNGVTPYHYFELWLNGFYAQLFSLSPLKSLMLITYPILKTTVFIGVLSIISLKQKMNAKAILLAFLLLFISAIFIESYSNWELTKYFIGYTQSGILSFGRKYLMLYIVCLLFALYYRKGQYSLAFLLLLFLPIFSIGSAPGIMTISGISLAYLAFKNKSYKPLVAVIVFSLLFIFFYKTFTIEETTAYVNNTALYQRLIINPTDILLIKELLFSFVFPFIRILLFYSPFILLILLLTFLSKIIDKKEVLTLMFLGLLTCLFSSFYAALLNGMLDAGQLLYNNLPLLNTLIIVILISLYQEDKFRKVLMGFLLINAIIHLQHFNKYITNSTPIKYNLQSSAFKQECIEELEKKSSKSIIAYSMNDANYSKGALLGAYNIPCFFLGLTNKGAHFVDINTFRIEEIAKNLPPEDKHFLDKNEINIYQKLSQNRRLSVQSIQNKFIDTYNINYLYIQKNSTLSDGFLKDEKVERVITDKYSGDQFITLK